MSKRKAGYYWVRDGQGWEPLRWSGCLWDGHLNDADLEEIGPRIPSPDEPWQCVPSNGTTDQMDDAARGLLLMLSMRSDISYERLREELAMRDEDDLINALPEYAQFGEGHVPKAAQADILFRLMLSAAPEPEDV